MEGIIRVACSPSANGMIIHRFLVNKKLNIVSLDHTKEEVWLWKNLPVVMPESKDIFSRCGCAVFYMTITGRGHVNYDCIPQMMYRWPSGNVGLVEYPPEFHTNPSILARSFWIDSREYYLLLRGKKISPIDMRSIVQIRRIREELRSCKTRSRVYLSELPRMEERDIRINNVLEHIASRLKYPFMDREDFNHISVINARLFPAYRNSSSLIDVHFAPRNEDRPGERILVIIASERWVLEVCAKYGGVVGGFLVRDVYGVHDGKAIAEIFCSVGSRYCLRRETVVCSLHTSGRLANILEFCGRVPPTRVLEKVGQRHFPGL